jgi:hypothetical protein
MVARLSGFPSMQDVVHLASTFDTRLVRTTMVLDHLEIAMALPELLASTGHPQIDQIIQGVIGVFDLVFPNRLLGCYLQGSCADGQITALSDIDMAIVFHGELTAAESAHFDQILRACYQLSARRLDIGAFGERTLLHADQIRFPHDDLVAIYATTIKRVSRHVYGRDIRSQIPIIPITLFTRCVMHFAFPILASQRGHAATLTVPFTYPDPNDPFYGYTQRKLRDSNGWMQPSTKRLVHSTLFITTALVAFLAHRHAGSGREAVRLYHQYIGDQWGTFLDDLTSHCQHQWGYRVPEATHDQHKLREFCEQGLAFVNHFLAHYKAYLLSELQQPDPVIQRFALERLQRIIYPESAVVDAIQSCTISDTSLVQQAAVQALAIYRQYVEAT